MTDRLIVATFRDTNAAYDAASAIKNLKDSGLTEFKLKAGVMVQKDDRGNVSLIEDRNRPLVGTAVGTAAGALIGLLGGAPGVAVGAAIGATTGLSGDAVMAALDSDFVDSVTDGMRPGMTAKYSLISNNSSSSIKREYSPGRDYRPQMDASSIGGSAPLNIIRHRVSHHRRSRRCSPLARRCRSAHLRAAACWLGIFR